jgi:DNA-directed RNA polymerase subunit M/transcription elongation factor TFIIS
MAKKTEDGRRKTEQAAEGSTDGHGQAPTDTNGRVQTDGVDYPVMVCPACGMTDNVVIPSGRERAEDEHTRIRKCRQCDMQFKEHVP